MDVNKNLFLLWDTGYDNAPPVVRLCLDMWRLLNPTWRINIATKEELRGQVSAAIPPKVLKGMPIQASSDVYRLKMLSSHGGVWADATCLPHIPLDDWIIKLPDVGFAAPENTNDSRPIASWFMAARKESYALKAIWKDVQQYWQTPKRVLVGGRALHRHCDKRWENFLSDHTAKKLQLAPYFWLHYHFGKRLKYDGNFQREWGNDAYVMRGEYLFIRDTLTGSETGRDEKAMISQFLRQTDTPLSKLTWKADITYPLDTMRKSVLARAGLPVH